MLNVYRCVDFGEKKDTYIFECLSCHENFETVESDMNYCPKCGVKTSYVMTRDPSVPKWIYERWGNEIPKEVLEKYKQWKERKIFIHPDWAIQSRINAGGIIGQWEDEGTLRNRSAIQVYKWIKKSSQDYDPIVDVEEERRASILEVVETKVPNGTVQKVQVKKGKK